MCTLFFARAHMSTGQYKGCTYSVGRVTVWEGLEIVQILLYFDLKWSKKMKSEIEK